MNFMGAEDPSENIKILFCRYSKSFEQKTSREVVKTVPDLGFHQVSKTGREDVMGTFSSVRKHNLKIAVPMFMYESPLNEICQNINLEVNYQK